jgi:hypothetical protein
MKSTILVFLLSAFIVSFSACQKQEIESLPIDRVTSTRSDSEPMKSFDSMYDFQKAALEITKMPYDQFEKWLTSQGDFVSQWAFMDEIRAEMARVESWDEALEARKKYEGMYIFNPNEEDLDGDPYCPVSTKEYSFLLNKFGDVRIAGKVVNFNDLKTFDEVMGINPKTRAWNYNSNDVNKVQHQSNSKKRRFQVTSSIGLNTTYGVDRWNFRHQSKALFLWIGGPTTWYIYVESYQYHHSVVFLDFPKNGWEPFRRRSDTYLWVSEGRVDTVSGRVHFMTAGLQELKMMYISH